MRWECRRRLSGVGIIALKQLVVCHRVVVSGINAPRPGRDGNRLGRLLDLGSVFRTLGDTPPSPQYRFLKARCLGPGG